MHELATSLLGGVLVGLGASLLLVGAGQVAGISSILVRAIRGGEGPRGWRIAFVVGMVGTGALLALLRPGSVTASPAGTPLLLLSGVVVGFGTRLGGGCTSGHGVCGMARGSARSFVATVLFMTGGIAAVGLAGLTFGGIS